MTTDLASPAAGGRRVNADTLKVAPEILGLPLAEPSRRLLAMLIDLAILALLSLLSGAWLGLGTGVLLIVLLGNSRDAPFTLKVARTVARLLGAVVVLFSILALGHVSLVRQGALHLDALSNRAPSAAMSQTIFIAPDASPRELQAAVGQLERQVADLKAENRELHEAKQTWTYQARSFANTLGFTFGWSGVYFSLAAGALGGRTIGKLLLRIRAVKVNGTPFTFFDAFVRNGGYVAGVAMGLTGFLKLLWEPNRQAVEDRIASTVVVKG